MKTRYFTGLSVKAWRYAERPEKYTRRGDIRAAWKKAVRNLQVRAEAKLAEYQKRIDNGEDWADIYPSGGVRLLSDAFGNNWTLWVTNDSGTIHGVLEENGH